MSQEDSVVTRDELLEQIPTTFPKGPAPLGPLCVSQRGDPEHLNEQLCGKAWDTLSSESIRGSFGTLTFLRPHEYWYYLPAFLAWELRNHETTSFSDSLLSSLCHFGETAGDLSPEQVCIITAYLEWELKSSDWSEYTYDVAQLLQNWRDRRRDALGLGPPNFVERLRRLFLGPARR